MEIWALTHWATRKCKYVLPALPIVMYGETKLAVYLKNESENQTSHFIFFQLGHVTELRARVKSSLEMLLTALNIIIIISV